MHAALAQIPEDAARMQVAANPEKTTAVIAVGTLQNLAAESNANKEAIREAGGIPTLVTLIKRCPDSPVSPECHQTVQKADILPSHVTVTRPEKACDKRDGGA